MTELRHDSKVTRKTTAVVQRKRLVVVLRSGHLELRRLGEHRSLPMSYDAIYIEAARRAAERARAEKRAARKGAAA